MSRPKKQYETNCIFCGSSKSLRRTSIGVLCSKHSTQYYRYGKFIEFTRSSPNEIIDNNDGSATVILRNIHGEKTGEAIIDSDDIQEVSKYKWSLAMGYAQTLIKKEDGRRTIMRMHRLLFEQAPVVDHINGNGLDNRKCNLRAATNKTNQWNKHAISQGKSGVRGVYYVSKTNKWRAIINKDGIAYYLGTFATKAEAIRARRKAELHYYGEFAPR